MVLLNTLRNWLTWDFQVGWPEAIVFVPILICGLAAAPAVLIARHRGRVQDSVLGRYLAAVVLTTFVWGINGPLGLLYSTYSVLSIVTSELDKIAPIIGTIMLPIIAGYALVVVDRGLSGNHRTRAYATISLVLIITSASVVSASSAQVWLLGNFHEFATASQSDYDLLQWMRTGIPKNSTVLVNPFDAGQFVPSIGGRTAVEIASTGVVFSSPQYRSLYQQIANQEMNSTTVSLLLNLRIQYVFVGSKAFQGGWDSNYFVERPVYFRLIHQIGSSYLFANIISQLGKQTGLVNDSYFTGFSSAETLFDFVHMTVYDLKTGEGAYVQFGLKTSAGQVLETTNYWNEPKYVGISRSAGVSGLNATLRGTNYTLNMQIRSNGSDGMILNLAYQDAPQYSIDYLSLFPLSVIRQGSLLLNTSVVVTNEFTGHSPVSGIMRQGATTFELSSKLANFETFNFYLTAWSQGSFIVGIQTRPLD
jgi:hypothetical protein